MIPIIIAFAIFFGIEGFLRKGEAAKSLERGDSDRRSTAIIGASYGIGALVLLSALLQNYLQIGHFAFEGVVWIGTAMMIAGLMLRIWATQVLGEFYTRTLRTMDHQVIVERGPYRIIRHPGYLGVILLWVGAGLATENWIVTFAVALLMLIVYNYRIRSEEAMLVTVFGEQYKNYSARTRKLIPFIY